MTTALDSRLYGELPIVDADHHLRDLEGDRTHPWMTSGEHADQGDNSAFRRTCRSREYRRDTAAPPASGF